MIASAFTEWHGWDWQGWEALVAAGTFALAATTGTLAFKTRSVAVETKVLGRLTARHVEATERVVAGTIRPLLLSIEPSGPPDSGADRTTERVWLQRDVDPAVAEAVEMPKSREYIDRWLKRWIVSVPLINHGTGTAVVADPAPILGMHTGIPGDSWSDTLVGFAADDYVLPRETTRATFWFPTPDSPRYLGSSLVVEVAYTDVVGGQYTRTRLHYRSIQPYTWLLFGFALYDRESNEPRARSTNWEEWLSEPLRRERAETLG